MRNHEILLSSPALEPHPCELNAPDAWFKRVSALVPLMPFEVAEQWIFRHWGGSPDYNRIVVSTMSFRRETWTTEQLDTITGPGGQDPTFWMMEHDFLACSMRARGTWPMPIIVLDNRRPSIEAAPMRFGRMQLLEGHRRLSFIRQLAEQGRVEPSHDVWVASYPLDTAIELENWNPEPPPKYAQEQFNLCEVSPITKATPINCVPQEIFDDITDEELEELEGREDDVVKEFLESVRQRLIERG